MADQSETYILDACALIAFLRKEKGNEKLRELLKDKSCTFFMHAVNLGEVYYDTLRHTGEEKAKELFDDISRLPVRIIWSIDIPFLELTGKYKTSFSMSYADAFALALAEREEATVITTDHKEFDPVEKAGVLMFYWVR